MLKKPIRLVPTAHPEAVLELDHAGRAAAVRHIHQGARGARVVHMPSFFEDMKMTKPRAARAPYLDQSR